MQLIAATLFAILIWLPVSAQQSVIPNYDTARDQYFWPLLGVKRT